MTLEFGRPADFAERLEKEQRCYALLDKLDIPYARMDHPCAMTMEDCQRLEQVLNAPICKNLLLCNRQKTQFYLLMLPGDKQFQTSILSGQIGSSRLSFAGPEEMERLLDITPGSLSVLGLMNDLLLCNRQKTQFYLLMLPGDKQFQTSILSGQIGSSRLSFAGPEEMERLLDITPGSLSVLGLMNDPEHRVTLLIDQDVLKQPYFGCHPCINTSTLRISTLDLTEKLLPALGRSIRIVVLPSGL